MLTQVALIVGLMVGAQPEIIEIHYDFRGKKFDDKVFQFEGPNAAKIVKMEEEGLRITLTPEFGARKPVGIWLREWIKGDFIATVAYELLETATPPADSGLGVSLYVMLNSPVRDGINLGFFIREKEGHVFSISHMVDDKKEGRRVGKNFETFPAKSASIKGKLRVERVGSMLTQSVAEGNSSVFKQIAQLDVGPDDVRNLRFAADPGNGINFVDARITDFMIQTERMIPAGRPAELPGGIPGYWLVFGGIAAVAILFFGFRLWRRQRDPRPGPNKN